ncbi:hypothetical protein ACQP2U_43400 (plasmid) [Nocardia sp. CA-084685]|uniref:hypothetical protein n=1 Tax=Nocardia sp. CA-084685 TaxID=3239970 RepID=UPI003D97CFAF
MIEALHTFGAQVARARSGRDKRAAPADARATAGAVLAGLRAGVLPDAGETGRAGRIVVEILDGAEARLIAERVTDEALATAWWVSNRAGLGLRSVLPPDHIPDIPTLRWVRVEATPPQVLADRDALATAFTRLSDHVAAVDGRRSFAPGQWERQLLELATEIAATLRYTDPAAGIVTVGEIARGERVFAALVTFEAVGSERGDAWRAVTDPEFFHDWRIARADRIGDRTWQQYSIELADLARVRGLAITDRGTPDPNSEFVDAPGLRAMSLATCPPFTRMDRYELEQATHDLVERIRHGQRYTVMGETHDQWRDAIRELAEPILANTRDHDSGVLSRMQALQAERVIASLHAFEEPAISWTPPQLWAAITEENTFHRLLDERNTREVGLRWQTVTDPGVSCVNTIALAHLELERIHRVAEQATAAADSPTADPAVVLVASIGVGGSSARDSVAPFADAPEVSEPIATIGLGEAGVV